MACCLMVGGCSGNVKSYKESNSMNTTTLVAEDVESIDGFERANFDKFNSYASKNGLKDTKVFIDGVVEEKIVAGDTVAFSLKDGQNFWVIVAGELPDYDEQNVDKIVGKNVRIYGYYNGYSKTVDMPAVHCDIEDARIVLSDTSGEESEKISNSDNLENINYSRIEPSLIMAFVDMNVVGRPENISIHSIELDNNKVNVRLQFDLDGKRLECSGTVDNNIPNSNIELWDITLEGESEHYYWLAKDNTILEDNSIRRNDNNPYALYDFNTEKIIKSNADLPKGNLANVSVDEMIPLLQAALLDIGTDSSIKDIDIESRKGSGSIYVELYFYIDGKHLAADFSKSSNYDWELDEISLYDNPDYHYWLSSQIKTMLGTSLHNFNTDEEIDLEDREYTNYNNVINTKKSTQNESKRKSEKPIELSTGYYVVGEDISAGKYDIWGVESGIVFVCSEGTDYGDIVSEMIEPEETVYANARLKDGYIVKVENGGKIELRAK